MQKTDIIPTTNPAFDSDAWREMRNAKLREWIVDDNAIAFIVQFFDFCEVIDDLWDGDKPVTKDDLTRILFVVLTELPLNPFFDRFKMQLIPVIVTGVNAWLDANELEGGSDNDKVFSYVLRDWYAELIAFVIYLVQGRDYLRSVSMDVRRFFTHCESLEQYMEDLT
jgi:hypothetical protein